MTTLSFSLRNNYLSHRAEMKSGDLVEFASASSLGWIIRKFTKKDVNHTALVISGDLLPGRVIFLEALAKGLTPNFMSDRLEDFKGEVYWLPLMNKYDDFRRQMAEWAITEYVTRKPKYDYRGLIANAFSSVSIETRKYFCSEFAHKVWAEFGVVKAPDGEQIKAARPGEFEALGVTRPRVKLL